MPIKKRFSISPDLATGIRNTIQSASSNQGQLHYDMMSLDMIEPDPNNPRKLSITVHEVLNGLERASQNLELKTKELQDLNELSESILRLGIRNAIEVYKEGPKYRIISGERRYLAAILAKQKSIPVRINHKPDEFNLRYMQWVENMNRQDLSLAEKLTNLVSIADAYEKANQSEFNEEALRKLLNISSIQAYRYFCLLKADAKIIGLVQSGKINNLKIVQELVVMKDRIAKQQIITWITNKKEEITSISYYKTVAGKKINSFPDKNLIICLGKIKKIHVAKHLFEILLSSQYLENKDLVVNIDWSSTKSINQAFQTIIESIEKAYQLTEIA